MILAIDTSGASLGIGLADESGMLLREFHAEATPEERGIHDARLASEVATVLKSQGVSPRQIVRIGLILGPGSFTGLRIGLSFAKGLAFATGAAIVPLSQHEVISAMGVSGHIVTAGYREDLFYVADSQFPRDIRLVTAQELPAGFTIQFPSINVLARLAAESAEEVAGADLDGLEPLYITEFTVK